MAAQADPQGVSISGGNKRVEEGSPAIDNEGVGRHCWALLNGSALQIRGLVW